MKFLGRVFVVFLMFCWSCVLIILVFIRRLRKEFYVLGEEFEV